MTGKIRIIGGVFRGKTLTVLDQTALRPTPNRIRETLFNWLMHDIRHLVCLDAFSGSGALGLEALSRGAKQVVLIEKNPLVFNQLKQTALSFERPSLSCHNMRFLDYLNRTRDVFDLVFLDPPFEEQLLPACLEALHTSKALKPGGLVYLESDKPLPPPEPTWELIKSAKAASLFFGLYKKSSTQHVSD